MIETLLAWLTIHNIIQTGIAVFSSLAVWYVNGPDNDVKRKFIGAILGLVSQPFWFYAAWQTGQWGAGLLCVAYTFAWGRGIYRGFFALRTQRMLRKVRDELQPRQYTISMVNSEGEEICPSPISPISSNVLPMNGSSNYHFKP